ncbi:MAG: flagellar protein FlaG [Rhodospirillales bacterium]|nr:flagellar protein FlaG [Alphaproteobacteria bacterium]USO02944.1 MAG: flagellar protein FlaG [Rhodospirillales bacterium]
MIEAVNSVLSNAPLVRGNVEQQAASRSFAANPERVQEVARAPYVSPYIHVDVNFDRAVLQIRDSDTGDVLRQFPSESQLKAYTRAQAAAAALETQQRSETPEVKQPSDKTETTEEAPTPAPETAAPAQQQSTSALEVQQAVSVDTQA